MLELGGCLGTIGDMGCRKEIARGIADRVADYLLAVKDNQGQLYQDVRDLFEAGDGTGPDGLPHGYATTLNQGHGRIERRECRPIDGPACLEYLSSAGEWPGQRSVVKVESRRETTEGATVQAGYCISGLEASACGGAGPPERRKLASLEPGRDLPGGSEPGAQGPRVSEYGNVEEYLPQPAET